jgi:hypothetical protein
MSRKPTARNNAGRSTQNDRTTARLPLPGLIVATRKIAARVKAWTTRCDSGGKPAGASVGVNRPGPLLSAPEARCRRTSPPRLRPHQADGDHRGRRTCEKGDSGLRLSIICPLLVLADQIIPFVTRQWSVFHGHHIRLAFLPGPARLPPPPNRTERVKCGGRRPVGCVAPGTMPDAASLIQCRGV